MSTILQIGINIYVISLQFLLKQNKIPEEYIKIHAPPPSIPPINPKM